jgi:N-acetylneuraminic acid mutarotase
MTRINNPLPIGAALLWSFLSVCSLAAGQSSIENLDTQRMDVVKLRSRPSDRAAETAAGIYVGRDQQNAFFITALHPLRKLAGLSDPSDPLENVELQFYSRATLVPAKVFDHYDADIDLAVVYVPAVDLPPGTITIPAKDPSPLLSIHIIGHPPSGDWSMWPGTIQSETGVKNDERFFSTGTDESLVKGFSGGPVLDSEGNFIGMHQGTESKVAKNLKSGSIMAKLRLWHVPMNNLASSGIDVDKQDKYGYGAWSLGAPMPTARMGAFTGTIGNKIYVIGGENNNTVLSVNEIYDTTTDNWTTGSPMPTARWLGASAVVNNILYAMGGGLNEGGTNVVEAYNPKNNTWSSKRAMPPMGGNIYAVVQRNIIYVIGGYSNGTSLGAVWAYNPATDTWVEKAPLNVAKRLAAVGLLGATIIAAGGLANRGVTDDNEGYDPTTNQWKTLALMPRGRQGGCFDASMGILYFAGGHADGEALRVTNVLEAYSAKTNSWTTGLASMPDAVANPGSAQVAGRLYCFGGSDISTPFQGRMFNSVQIYKPTFRQEGLTNQTTTNGSECASFDASQGDESVLAVLGEKAFSQQKYECVIAYLEQAKRVQSSRVWERDYPFLAAAYLLARKDRTRFESVLQEMLGEMRLNHSFLHHGPAIGIALQNLTDIRHYIDRDGQTYIDKVVIPATVQIKGNLGG